MNPNNCATCDHKKHPDGGWCYMFKNEPTYRCLAHTARHLNVIKVAPPSTGVEDRK